MQKTVDQYLCKAWGETDLPVAAIVNGMEGVSAFLVEQWLGGDADHQHYDGTRTLPAALADMQAEWDVEGEAWMWSAEFEIGGISVQKVYHAATDPQTAPQPAAQQELIDWVVNRWHDEVANRPLVNIHRRSLDGTWRQVLRRLGVDDEARLGPPHDDLLSAQPQEASPIDMVLHCPKCGMQHIDAREKVSEARPVLYGDAWLNPPHRSHLCHGCGHIWRPADVPTNGVRAVKTTGKADSPIAPGKAHVAQGATVPGLIAAAEHIDGLATGYAQEHAYTEPDTGAVVFDRGDVGLEYHSTLTELADDLRALAAAIDAARSQAKEGAAA